MRTTMTLDPDVERLVRDAMHRARRPMKDVVNDGLRRGLAEPDRRRHPYRLVAHSSMLRPGLDLSGFNRMADETEDEAILEALAPRR